MFEAHWFYPSEPECRIRESSALSWGKGSTLLAAR